MVEACARRNRRHDVSVARSGAGGIRRSFRIMRIVGALWPRCPRRLPRSWGLAALVAVAVAVLAVTVLDLLLVGHGPAPAAWRTLLVGGAVDVAVLLAGLRVLHVTEVDPRVARLRHR
jgi:hypothetical protein